MGAGRQGGAGGGGAELCDALRIVHAENTDADKRVSVGCGAIGPSAFDDPSITSLNYRVPPRRPLHTMLRQQILEQRERRFKR
jgi:hypothetical protein